MSAFSPEHYEEKFADFIRMCADLKAQGVKQVVVANPKSLGDTYEEVIESLSRLAEAGLALHVAAREPQPGRN